MIRVMVGRIGRPRAELAEPLLVVPFGPHADLIAPFVDGQRNAASIEDTTVRFVFRGLTVDDDAVESKITAARGTIRS
jgi:hypothetical protein